MLDPVIGCCVMYVHILRIVVLSVDLQSIEGAIGGNAYQHNKVNQWTSNVVEQCLNQLTKLNKPFKYIGKYRNNINSPVSLVYYVVTKWTCCQLSMQWLHFYAVTCVIMQKNGAGLHTASSCFWDNSTDGKNLKAYFCRRVVYSITCQSDKN